MAGFGMAFFRRVARRLTGRSGPRYLAEAYPKFAIGRGSYGGLTVVEFGEGAELRMGAYCSIAAGVHVLLGGEHRTDWTTTYPFSELDRRFAHIRGHPRTKGDVVIGNDVWVGRDAVILSGVKIGDGAVVAARAVVARDVEPYAIVGGNPAKLVRSRFDPDTVSRLLAIAWWDWPTERIEAAIPRLLSPRIADFLDAAEGGLI